MPDEAEVARPAGADAAHRRPSRGALRRRRRGPARGSGPVALGPSQDRRGPGGPRPGAGAGRPRPVRAAGARSPRSTWTSPRLAQIAALYGELAASPGRRSSSSTGPSPSPRAAMPPTALAIVDGARSRRLPLSARHPGGAAAAARPLRSGPDRVPASAGAGPLRSRARAARAAAGGARGQSVSGESLPLGGGAQAAASIAARSRFKASSRSQISGIWSRSAIRPKSIESR